MTNVRVEQARRYFIRARHTLFLNGVLAASSEGSLFTLSYVRLIAETEVADGQKDVVATVSGNEWSAPYELCTVSYDGQPIRMQVVQSRWFSMQPWWLKGMFVFGSILLAVNGDTLFRNTQTEYAVLAACVALVVALDTVTVFPSVRKNADR